MYTILNFYGLNIRKNMDNTFCYIRKTLWLYKFTKFMVLNLFCIIVNINLALVCGNVLFFCKFAKII